MANKKKKNRNSLFLLGGAFVVLLALVLITSAGKDSGALGPDGGPLFGGIDVMDLTAVMLDYDWEIQHMGRIESIGLEREEDAWYITVPGRYKTDPMKAAEFLERVISLESRRRIEPDASDLSQFGLDEPRLVIDVATKKTNIRLLIGGDMVTSVEQERIAIAYAKFENDDYVYIVNAERIDMLNEHPDDLRFRHVFQFDRGDLLEVTFDYQGRTLDFVREDGDWYLRSGAPEKRQIRNERMTAFLADFYNFAVDGFIVDEGRAWDYDIKPGERNYLRVLCRERGEMMLSFGREITERITCMVEGDPAVYEVEKFKFERLNQDEDYFFGLTDESAEEAN